MEDIKKEGDTIQLKNQMVRVEKCKICDSLMVNLDTDQLAEGDLVTLKRAGIVISNPETDKLVCIKCEYRTFGRKIADFFESTDDDDSHFFNPPSISSPSSSSIFGGHSSFGGFGGFGGGGFSGGGASRAF
jgi:uncharacterized membrane protein YgcG